MRVVSEGGDFAIDLSKSVFEKHVSLVCGGRQTQRSSVVRTAIVRRETSSHRSNDGRASCGVFNNNNYNHNRGK